MIDRTVVLFLIDGVEVDAGGAGEEAQAKLESLTPIWAMALAFLVGAGIAIYFAASKDFREVMYLAARSGGLSLLFIILAAPTASREGLTDSLTVRVLLALAMASLGFALGALLAPIVQRFKGPR